MEIYKITATFLQDEKYGLSHQMRNSANSVITSIAEAHGRYYFVEKTKVFYTYRGEFQETKSYLSVDLGIKYINTKTFDYLDKEYEELTTRN